MAPKKKSAKPASPLTRVFTTDLRYGLGRLRWGDDMNVVAAALPEGILWGSAGAMTTDLLEGLDAGLLPGARGLRVLMQEHDNGQLAAFKLADLPKAQVANFLVEIGQAHDVQADATWTAGPVTLALAVSGDDATLTITLPAAPAPGDAPDLRGPSAAPPSAVPLALFHNEPLTAEGEKLEVKLRKLADKLYSKPVPIKNWLAALEPDPAAGARALYTGGVIEALGYTRDADALVALLKAGVPPVPPRRGPHMRTMLAACVVGAHIDRDVTLAVVDRLIAEGASLDDVDNHDVSALEVQLYHGTRTPGLFDALWERATPRARAHVVASALLPMSDRVGRQRDEIAPVLARLVGTRLDAPVLRGLSPWHLAAAHADVATLGSLLPFTPDLGHRTAADATVNALWLVFNQVQVPAGDLDAVGVIDVLLRAAEANAPMPSCLEERAALLERLHANRAWLAAR